MLNQLIEVEKAIVARLVYWYQQQRAQAELYGLDDHALADIGITRADIPGIQARPRSTERAIEAAVPSGKVKHAA